jgi:hypothetical protein
MLFSRFITSASITLFSPSRAFPISTPHHRFSIIIFSRSAPRARARPRRGDELVDRIIAKTSSREKHFSEADAVGVLAQILEAVGYCHGLEPPVLRGWYPR